jgi:hypothetical protein
MLNDLCVFDWKGISMRFLKLHQSEKLDRTSFLFYEEQELLLNLFHFA